MTEPIALDSSIAVALLVSTHPEHPSVAEWYDGRKLPLAGHALSETYSVITRLPEPSASRPDDAATLIEETFAPAIVLSARIARQLPRRFANLNIAGGAIYDALVALTALEHEHTLATRDARAKLTYELVGVPFVLVT